MFEYIYLMCDYYVLANNKRRKSTWTIKIPKQFAHTIEWYANVVLNIEENHN